MKALDLHNCEIGAITSKPDHSVAFRVLTPELRVSESGELMQWHGRACRVTILPNDTTDYELTEVTTERGDKTPSQRWRGVLFIAWKQGVDKRDNESFDAFYCRQYEKLLDFWKAKLTD